MERLTDRDNNDLVRLQSHIRGGAVRNQVRVSEAAPGIVHTRIKRPPEGRPMVGGRAEEIMQNMAVGDTYDRLRIEQGAGEKQA